MKTNSPFYAGFAVDDVDRAKEFHGQTLGLDVSSIDEWLLPLRAPNGYPVLIYVKPTHEPAAQAILNFPVDDIEAAVERRTTAGVVFEHSDEGAVATNEQGIAMPGPEQAWFKDPAGNIVSVIES